VGGPADQYRRRGLSCSHPGCGAFSCSSKRCVNCAESAERVQVPGAELPASTGRADGFLAGTTSWGAIDMSCCANGYGAKLPSRYHRRRAPAVRRTIAGKELCESLARRKVPFHGRRSRIGRGHALELAKHGPRWWLTTGTGVDGTGAGRTPTKRFASSRSRRRRCRELRRRGR